MGNALPPGFVYSVNISPGGVPKRPVEQALLQRLGLEGDDHADRRHHGGPERAVCLYSLELIKALQGEGHPVAPGALGENLTLAGIPYRSLRPGDRLRIGEAEIELTRPTTPCRTIAPYLLNGDISRVLHSRLPGWSRFYARVLTPGVVRRGDPVTLLLTRSRVD